MLDCLPSQRSGIIMEQCLHPASCGVARLPSLNHHSVTWCDTVSPRIPNNQSMTTFHSRDLYRRNVKVWAMDSRGYDGSWSARHIGLLGMVKQHHVELRQRITSQDPAMLPPSIMLLRGLAASPRLERPTLPQLAGQPKRQWP